MNQRSFFFFCLSDGLLHGARRQRNSGCVRLPPVFGDNMVLQQQSTVTIWGWADPGEAIRATAGWSSYRASAGSDGKWRARFETSKAGGPYLITVEGKSRIELKNIMLGEAWLCSGQSNMEYTIKDLGGGPAPSAPTTTIL